METKHKKEKRGESQSGYAGGVAGGQQARKQANDILVFLPRNLIWGCHGEL